MSEVRKKDRCKLSQGFPLAVEYRKGKRPSVPDSVSGPELIHQLNARLTVSQSRATILPSCPLQTAVTN